MDNQTPGGSYCTIGEYDGFGIPAHLIANYAMAEALLACDQALNSSGPACEESGDSECEVDMQRLRQSVQLAANFTIRERFFTPDWYPQTFPPYNNGPHWRGTYPNKGGWRYRYRQDPDDWNHHQWRWADPMPTPWGTMALKASEMAEVGALAADPSGLSEMEIARKALEGLQTNPYGSDGEWIGDHFEYGVWGHSYSGMDAGCLVSMLLTGANPAHPIFAGGEAQAGSREMFPIREMFPQGETETSEEYEARLASESTLEPYEARLASESTSRYEDIPIGTQTTLGGWLADHPPMLDPWTVFSTQRIADYVGDDNYKQELKAFLEANQINNPDSHMHGSWTVNFGRNPNNNCGRHMATCLLTAALGEIENGTRMQP